MTAMRRRLKKLFTIFVTPPTVAGSKFTTNLDTSFIKLIAAISMVFDHVGMVFFPDVLWLRCIGRLSFPLFCYCMTVGMLYTKNIKKYMIRLAILAVISQPVYLMALYPDWSEQGIFPLNVFFTLLFSLATVYGVRQRQWWLTFIGVYMLIAWDAMYSLMGFFYMLLFYLCRTKLIVGCLLLASMISGESVSIGNEIQSAATIHNISVSPSIYAILSAPFIYIKTHVGLKIPKSIFYLFYPAHLMIIAFIRAVY